jgi:hypothetical protein
MNKVAETSQASLISTAAIASRLLALAAGVGLLWFASRGYYSQYELVSARLGEKSLTQYENLLNQSLDYDPSNGRASAERAAYLTAQKKYDTALVAQAQSMQSYRTLTSYEQLGRIEERLAEQATTETKQTHSRRAREYFEKAERVRPGNITALEHLMVLAYRSGENDVAESYASELARLDMDNPNAIYVRALIADRNRNFRAAYGLYQRIASLREVPKGAFFTPAVVQERLNQLRTVEQF